jgi:hypothetical protein
MRNNAIVLALFLAAPLGAQVEIVCGPLPLEHSRSIFDKRTARNIQPWPCVLTNMGPGLTSISEAAIQGWMMRQGVSALSAEAIRIGAGEIKRRGKWATIGRALPLAAMLGTALIATDGLVIEEMWARGAFSFGAFALPEIGRRLAGRDPDDSIFEQLAIHGDVALDSGRSATVYMWSAPLAGAQPISGVLSSPPSPAEIELSRWEGGWPRPAAPQRMAGFDGAIRIDAGQRELLALAEDL